jgi:hypothetical protein
MRFVTPETDVSAGLISGSGSHKTRRCRQQRLSKSCAVRDLPSSLGGRHAQPLVVDSILNTVRRKERFLRLPE